MVRMPIAWVAALVSFCLLDFAWLSFMGPRLYKPALGEMLADKPRFGAALVFYALYISGVVYFAVRPALESGAWRTALLNGALLGLLAYATYDLTNQATLRIWPVKVTVLDVVWGGIVTASAATASYLVTAWTSRSGG